MKKLCAKQNRRAKQWEFSQSVRKLFAMCCEFRNAKNHSEFRNAKFRNAKTTLQISQCEKPHCEFRNAKNHIANFAMRKTTANFAMRNFAMRKPYCKFRNAKRKFRNAKWLPTDCENSCFSFSLLIFNICSKICTKLLKLKQEKLHKDTN